MLMATRRRKTSDSRILVLDLVVRTARSVEWRYRWNNAAEAQFHVHHAHLAPLRLLYSKEMDPLRTNFMTRVNPLDNWIEIQKHPRLACERSESADLGVKPSRHLRRNLEQTESSNVILRRNGHMTEETAVQVQNMKNQMADLARLLDRDVQRKTALIAQSERTK